MRSLAFVLVASLLFVAPAGARVAKPFPRGFLWGTAISAFQSEMGGGAPNDTNTDWWVWVHDDGNRSGGLVSQDLPENGPGFYTRYKSDAKLARQQLKGNALRLSIEWSRIFPSSTAAVDISGGITRATLVALDELADQTEVAHYRAVLKALRAKKLVPMVTLNHFTLPLWVHEPFAVRTAFTGVDPREGNVPSGLSRAGWLDPAIVGEFAKFAAYAGYKFGDLVDLWCTINEPVGLLVGGYVNAPGVGGGFPPGVFSLPAVAAALPQIVAAHARAYDALHLTDTQDADHDGVAAKVGIVHNMVAFEPSTAGNDADIASVAKADYVYNRAFLLAITRGDYDVNLNGTIDAGEHRDDFAGRSDFIGVNYYLRAAVHSLGMSLSSKIPLFDFIPTFSYRTAHNPGGTACPTTCSDFGSEIYPAGLREVLTFVGTLGVPVYITENGIADEADTKRAQYIVDHLSVLQGVIQDHVADVRGYFYWSLTDNFEWASGYYPSFGLFDYVPATGKRIRRAGAKPLRTIAQKNGIPAKLAP